MSPRQISRIRRFVVFSVFLSLTSGCAWYEGLSSNYDERERNLGKYDVSEQDEYLRKFYQLQRRIDDLEARLKDEQASPRAPKSSSNRVNSRAESAIAYLKQKTRDAIGAIDRLIANIEMKQAPAAAGAVKVASSNKPAVETLGSTETQEAAESAPPIQKGDISGVLERSENGTVVKSTTTGNRYNYSVVYVYPETQPWFDMWSLLDNAGITDKWRGKNEGKQSYFIYVGAYYTAKPAERRQKNLMAITGEQPEVRVRRGVENVAMQ